MGCASSGASSSRQSVRLGHQAFHKKYVLGKKLGQGAFGQVRAAAPRSSEQQAPSTPTRAVKILDLGGTEDHDHKQLLCDALAEEAAWRAAGTHENILELMEFYVDTGEHKMAYFVMEICAGSLLDEQNRHLLGNAEAFVDIAWGMRAGLAHLHRRNIVHRDVKPANFLLGADKATVKLCDFGTASVVPKKGLKGVFGTPAYMAPEMLDLVHYRVGVDTWSYGVTCYMLLLGDYPYKPAAGIPESSGAFKYAIMEGKPPLYTPADEAWPALLPCAKEFLKALLTRDAQERPLLDDMESHAFFDSGPEGFASEWATERQDRGPIVAAAVEKATNQVRLDPTRQKSVDDRLRSLQKEQGPRSGVAHRFSEHLAFQPLQAADKDASTVHCQSSHPATSSHLRSKDALPMKPSASVGTRKFQRQYLGGRGHVSEDANVQSECLLAGVALQKIAPSQKMELTCDSASSQSDSVSEDENALTGTLLVGAGLQKIAPSQKVELTDCKLRL